MAPSGCPMHRWAAAAPSWWPMAAKATMKAVIACCMVLYFFYMWDWLNDSHYVWFAGVYDYWGIKYDRGDVQILDAYDTFIMAAMWAPLLLAAAMAMAWERVPRGTVPAACRRAATWARLVKQWQIPPRRFFAWWCGGMSALDAFLLALYLAYNAWYFGHYYDMYVKQLDAVEASGITYPEPRAQLMLERVALIFGIMAWPNLWLLFLPIPHNSFLQATLGINYAEGIRYHRWFGHGTLIVLTLHGVLYYLYWIAKGEAFGHYFFDWGTESSINYFAGTLSILFAWPLWITSITWVRRNFFEVFYRTHIICFVGFTMFAYMHYFWSWSYFLPALILYGADLAMRAGQMGNVAVVGLAQDSSTASHPDSDVLTLQLRGSKHLRACPLQDIFCVFPTISRWQWHPFSLAAVERNAKDGAIHLKLHIKRYGNFTKALFEQLRASRYLPVRVSGMASRDAWGSPWLDYHTLLLVGGGVGAAPLLSVINSLIKLKEEHQAAIAEADDKTSKKTDARHTFPSHVSLFWTCRHPEEFAAMADASLLMAAESWLSLRLHCTSPAAGKGTTTKDEGSPRTEDDNSPTSATLKQSPSKFLVNNESGSDDGNKASVASTASVLTFPGISPLFLNKARAMQPRAWGYLHACYIVCLAFVGALLGTWLGGAEWAERNAYYTTAEIVHPTGTAYSWRVGLTWFFCQAIMILGMPYLFGVLPAQLWAYWRGDASELITADEISTAVATAAPCCLSGDGEFLVAASGGASVTIQRGRPNIVEAMKEAAAVAGKTAEETGAPAVVGLLVGGPRPMTHDVHLRVSEMNGKSKETGAKFLLHAVAHEL